MDYKLLKKETIGHVAVITLNRPEKLNALNKEIRFELVTVLEEIGGQFPDIRVVVLTGEGRGFCAGADVGEQADGLPQELERTIESVQRDHEERQKDPARRSPAPLVREIPQPVIAAVNGVAAGMGLSIALACDIRIASEHGRFSCVFIKRSLVPDTGAAYLIPSLVGPGIAAEMALTGRVYDADWALRVGLVNKVVPQEDLMADALSIAHEIAANPPLAVRSTKQLLYDAASTDLNTILPMEGLANAPSWGTEDRRESLVSFLEKRDPVYHGR